MKFDSTSPSTSSRMGWCAAIFLIVICVVAVQAAASQAFHSPKDAKSEGKAPPVVGNPASGPGFGGGVDIGRSSMRKSKVP